LMSEIPTYHDREWLEHEKKVLGLLMLAVQRRALILLTATLNFFDFQTDRLTRSCRKVNASFVRRQVSVRDPKTLEQATHATKP